MCMVVFGAVLFGTPPLVKLWKMCGFGKNAAIQEIGVDQELWEFGEEFEDLKHVHDPLDGDTKGGAEEETQGHPVRAVAARCTVGHSSRTFRLDVGYACTTEHHREVSSSARRLDPAGGRWPTTLPLFFFSRTRGCRSSVRSSGARRWTTLISGGAEARNGSRARARLLATQRASRSTRRRRASSAESPSKHSSPPRPRLASRIRARNVREERNANDVARTTREGKPPCRAVARDEEVRGLLLEQG